MPFVNNRESAKKCSLNADNTVKNSTDFADLSKQLETKSDIQQFLNKQTFISLFFHFD